MYQTEIPYPIQENRIEYMQYIAFDNDFLVMIYSSTHSKYNLYWISDHLLNLLYPNRRQEGIIFPLTADEVIEKFLYVPLDIAMTIFPHYEFDETNYGF